MKFIIADPPYLGRAELWYGGKGRSKKGTHGRAAGRGDLDREFHPDAAKWDNPQSHLDLMAEMERSADGWALAASAKTLPAIASGIPPKARIAVWHVTNAIPDGSRVRTVWEPVIIRVPDSRRAWGTGISIPDLLDASHPCSSFAGSKPTAWTGWVLDMLGAQPDDEIVDQFTGSGAVTAAAGRLL